MEGQAERQWGVTKAISQARPSELDIKLNDQLIDTLKAENNFESPEGIERRNKVLNHLQKATEEFVRRVCKKKGLPESTIQSAGGKLFTFGSYALGVSNPGSDIDTLLVAPKHVNLEDFFDVFPPTLREMSKSEDITELNCVREAYVPIIGLEYCNVAIDLLFVSLPSASSVPLSLERLDKNVLRGLDDISMRAVNGTRVTTEMLDSVPQPKAFRHATRAIKLWSNQRGIYGNVFGFPGGVAWAIMVARIAQLYPNACGATILSKFFGLMMKWPWPRPVMLKNIEDAGMGLRVWNPTIYPGDRQHIMPIITPAFPSMCATHTIMHSTKDVMMKEFERADVIVNAIQSGKKSWSHLFERHTFFTEDHKYYLSIIATGLTKEAHESFSGLVQSRVRLIAKGIDDGDTGVLVARPYVKGVPRVHRCKNEEEVERVKQGHVDYALPEAELAELKNKTSDGVQDTDIVYTTTFYIGLTLPEDGTKSLDISYPVSSFKERLEESDTYDETKMSVRVVHTRNYDLPADLFKEGEVRPNRPTKAKKKKKAKSTATSSKSKRPFAETGLDDSQSSSSKRRQSQTVNGIPTPTPA